MNDTVTKLMALADDYANAVETRDVPLENAARQALQDELVRLFTPLTDEQINALWPSPEGTNTIQMLFRVCENAHGITGESNET